MYPNNWMNASGPGYQIPPPQAYHGHVPRPQQQPFGQIPQQASTPHQQYQNAPRNAYPGYSNSQHMAPHPTAPTKGNHVDTQTSDASQVPSYGASYGMLNQSVVPPYSTPAQGRFFTPMMPQNYDALYQAPVPNNYPAYQQPSIAGGFGKFPLHDPLQSPFANQQLYSERPPIHPMSSSKAGGPPDDARGAFQMRRERGNTAVQTGTVMPPFGPQGRLALTPPPPVPVTHRAHITSMPTLGAVIVVHSRKAAGCGGTYSYYADKQGREEHLWMTDLSLCRKTLVTEVKVWLGKQNWSALGGNGIEVGGPFYMKVQLEGRRKQRFVLIPEQSGPV